MNEISLLHYFMAHAPEKPQDWFYPEMPSPRPVQDHFSSKDGFRHFKNEEDAKSECKSGYITVTKDGIEWGHAAHLWDIERNKQTYIQWPLAWAMVQMEQAAKYNGGK